MSHIDKIEQNTFTQYCFMKSWPSVTFPLREREVY